MSVRQAKMSPLVIPQGAAVSQSLAWATLADAEAISVGAPPALDTTTYTWEVSYDSGTTWQTLVDSLGAAIPVPAAGKAMVFNGVFGGFTNIRLKAADNAAAARTFQLMKIFSA